MELVTCSNPHVSIVRTVIVSSIIAHDFLWASVLGEYVRCCSHNCVTRTRCRHFADEWKFRVIVCDYQVYKVMESAEEK